MPVMRKPDRTKNRSTPRSPYLVTPTMACSTQLVGSIWPTKWNNRTIRTARPRTPSSAGRCPPTLGSTLGPGLAPAGAGPPDVTTGFDGEVTYAVSDMRPTLSAPPTLAQGIL